MATRQKKKLRKEFMMGAGALAGVLLVLVLLVLCLPKAKSQPAYTRPPETVLPPNPFDETDFQYDGKYLTCLTQESALGIDVSAHQGKIDWQKVADAGVEFVMIRVGYRGYETGLLNEDTHAQSNYKGAKDAGLQVGAYFFSQAITPDEALEEAIFVLETVKDWQMDLPVVFDWEYMGQDSRTAQVSADTVMACIRAFNDRILQAGHSPMLYFNPYHAEHFLELEELADYPFWLAMYTDHMDYAYAVDMWQYTSEGEVAGIEGPVDLNLWFAPS